MDIADIYSIKFNLVSLLSMDPINTYLNLLEIFHTAGKCYILMSI